MTEQQALDCTVEEQLIPIPHGMNTMGNILLVGIETD
jgi:hypothetical protein